MYSTVQYMNIYTSLHKCMVLQDGKATTNKFMQDLFILGVKSMTGNFSIFLFWAIFRLCWYLLCCLLLLFYIIYSICDKFQIQVVWYAHVIYYKNSGHSQQLTHKFLILKTLLLVIIQRVQQQFFFKSDIVIIVSSSALFNTNLTFKVLKSFVHYPQQQTS